MLLLLSTGINSFILVITLLTMGIYLSGHKQLAIKIGTLALLFCSIYNYSLFCPSVSACFIIIANNSTYPLLVYLACDSLVVTVSIGNFDNSI